MALTDLASAANGRPDAGTLAEQIRGLPSTVLSEEERESAAGMIPDDLDRRLRAANRSSSAEWKAIKTRDDWQRFRDDKLRRLRKAVGPLPDRPAGLRLKVTATFNGDGYRIQNLVFQSRPGLWVTANLYLPAEPAESMPGMLICHSHHTPKEHGELQDMDMTWARRGCLVLVPDLLGHGERRQHPFVTEADYPKPFRVGRQDYYFRYDLGMQLALAGESLMGWFVWDIHSRVTVLTLQPGVDQKRIVILGAVAGGGFLPWTIVGAIALRPFIYAHEFAWNRPHDPVWRRLQSIWSLHGAEDKLAAVRGRGSVNGRPPESTHCTHIGLVHRRSIHPAFRRWFDIDVTENHEYSARLESDRLRCITPAAKDALKPRRICDLLCEITAARIVSAPSRQDRLSDADRREQLRQAWSAVLGRPRPCNTLEARVVAADDVRTIYKPAVQSYRGADSADKLVIQETTKPASRWLLQRLCGPSVGDNWTIEWEEEM